MTIDVSRYVTVDELQLQLEFVTPAFLGGADQNAELRPASFKGMLRYWWRVLYGAKYGTDIYKEEGDRFGTTDNKHSKASVVSIQLIAPHIESQNSGFTGKLITVSHAMISDSLNNFARYAVQPAIQKAGGRLIYAGGDDVCAVLPLSTALDAADKIRKAYTYSFAKYTAHGAEPITVASPDMPSVGMNMGSGAKGISISGAIVLAHHKEPLREVISDAHHVLDDCAKEKAGRNALAIRLKKRSGGDRDFAFKWDEDNPYRTGEKTIDSFKSIMQAAKDKKIGAALLYKFGEFKQLVEPLKNDEDKVIKIFEYEVSHSGKNIADAEKYAQQLAGICVHTDKNNSEDKNWFRPEAAIIASFWAIGNEETDGGTQK